MPMYSWDPSRINFYVLLSSRTNHIFGFGIIYKLLSFHPPIKFCSSHFISLKKLTLQILPFISTMIRTLNPSTILNQPIAYLSYTVILTTNHLQDDAHSARTWLQRLWYSNCCVPSSSNYNNCFFLHFKETLSGSSSSSPPSVTTVKSPLESIFGNNNCRTNMKCTAAQVTAHSRICSPLSEF